MKGNLEAKEGRLGIAGVIEQLLGLGMGAKDDLFERLFELGVKELADLIEGLCIGGVGLVQRFAHPHPLGALAGEQIGELGLRSACLEQIGAVDPRSQGTQTLQQLLTL